MRVKAIPLPGIVCMLLLTSTAAGAAIRRARSDQATQPSITHVPERDSVPAPDRVDTPVPRSRPPRQSFRTRSHQPADPGSPQADVDRWTTILARDPETAAALRRLRTYSQLIDETLSLHRVPADFAALPIIESGLLPQATSRAGAAGIWQLMPATARAYGLEVSPWVDERRDPVRSTQAAARHLHDLYGELGSWHLAAAAYNCGSARLKGAIGPARTDLAYWNYRHRLPAETRAYVPKLLAAVRLARANDASRPGADAAANLRFVEVTVPGGVDLSAIAAAYGFTADTLARLNPHLVRRSTPPGRSWPVRLPAR